MGMLRRSRWFVGWLAVMALVGNIAASAFCCMPRAAERDAGMLDTFWPGAICVFDGSRAASPGGVPPGSSRKHDSKPSCPTCVLIAAAALAVALLLVGHLDLRLAVRLRLWPDRQARRSPWMVADYDSRGPPLPA